MAATEFYHYGVKVIEQYMGEELHFRDVLIKNGIDYIELPIEDDVITYVSNGKKKYAYSYFPYVFITESIPDDMYWYGIVIDYEKQSSYLNENKDKEPIVMRSKLHDVLHEICSNAMELLENEIEDSDDDETLLFGKQVDHDKYIRTCTYMMREAGWSVKRVKHTKKHDVDIDFLLKLYPELTREDLIQ